MRKALFAALLFLISCSSSPVPEGIIPPNQMQPIVADMIQVDEFINNFLVKDTALDIKKKRSILYEQVFKMHNTTRTAFYSSFKYYGQHPNIQKALFDSLSQEFTRKKGEKYNSQLIKRESGK